MIRNALLRALFLSAVLGLIGSPLAGAGSMSSPRVMIMLPPKAVAPSDLSRQVQQLRAEGLIGEVLRFDATPGQENHGFSLLLILQATSEDAVSRLEKAEHWPKDARVRRVDPAFKSGDISTAAPESVFEVNLYRLRASEQRYKQFVGEYISPLMDAQIAEGLMRSYTMYIERGAEGDRQALLLKAYLDAPTYEKKMPDAKLAIRKRLESEHQTYPKWHPIKDEVRYDLTHTVAKQRKE
jgi:hypothetical protein